MTDKASDLVIRPARVDDVDAALPLIYSSGPEVWDLLFGNGEAESSFPYLREEWLSGKGIGGYRAHWVAERDGVVLGAVAVYDHAEHKRQGDQTAKHALKYFGWRVLLRVRLMLRVSKSFMKPPGKDVDYVANFGVAAEARGQGIGGAMLQHFLERAAERGKRFYELDVSLDNPRGEALYARFGMKVIRENHDAVFEKRGLVGTRRMQMAVPKS
ncbi:MAG: GNAT family N-acetyltransferase [Gammaproteobacteria bacterium]|nr:GNAT family N-acetyltransferase [Gammaproteobacteria bacterium]